MLKQDEKVYGSTITLKKGFFFFFLILSFKKMRGATFITFLQQIIDG